MLCACYRDGAWWTLFAYEEPGTGRLVLLERRGACPGDPDGTPVGRAGLVEPGTLIAAVAAWRRRGWAAAADTDRPARLEYAPRPAVAVPVAADPGDRTLGRAAARAVVEAAVHCSERPFCVFPNPDARQR